MNEFRVGRVVDFGGGTRRIVEAGGGDRRPAPRGRVLAYENVCVHQGDPAGKGRIVGRVVEVHDAAGNYRGQRFDDSEPASRRSARSSPPPPRWRSRCRTMLAAARTELVELGMWQTWT